MAIQINTFGGIGGSEPNSGYVTDWWLLDVRDVLHITRPQVAGGRLVAGAVLLTDTAVATRLAFGTKAATATLQPQRGPEGVAYGLGLAGSLPRPGPALLGWLAGALARRWLVIYRDRNGVLWLGGTRSAGLVLGMTHQTAERNVLELTLTGTYLAPPTALVETTMAGQFPDADFDGSFDLAFSS